MSVASPGIRQFLRQLYAEMNFDDDHSSPHYIGLASSADLHLPEDALRAEYQWRG
jgi:hypothetical protein